MKTLEATHTPGPWSISKDGNDIDDANGCGVVALYADERSEANARLIVQAVNERASLLAERDALRAALEDCIESLSRLPDKDGAWRVTTIAEARAALAQGRHSDR